MCRVLIVEDDKEIRELLGKFLSQNGFLIKEARDGSIASRLMAQETYDVILMDMMLPFKSGDELIKEIRSSKDVEKSRTPVIVISAKTKIETRIEVLRMGADDYILKPFDLNEVLARIEVVLRRVRESKNEKDDLTFKSLKVSQKNNTVSCNDKELSLTSKERQLLILFMKNPKKTFSKANLYETVWEEDYIYEDNTINVHISNLRSKLKKAAGEDIIETVWGIGYRLKQN